MADTDLKNLRAMIARAEELVAQLKAVYERDLRAQVVSLDALNITHEIIEKCSNVMDQAMTLYFYRTIAPLLTELPSRGGYFPAARDEQSYRSSMGRWNATDLQDICPEADTKLRSLQPFSARKNEIYARIRDLAAKKHTSLEPQVRQEQRRVSVTRAGSGSVSWDAGVRFGEGVSIMDVPIDPITQLPAHNQSIDVSEEVWVSFNFEKSGEDAWALCKQAPPATNTVLNVLFGCES